VVQSESGLCGGLFADRAQAFKFALSENGNHPQGIIMVPDGLELDLAGRKSPSDRRAA
jgi:hypothetical protein